MKVIVSNEKSPIIPTHNTTTAATMIYSHYWMVGGIKHKRHGIFTTIEYNKQLSHLKKKKKRRKKV